MIRITCTHCRQILTIDDGFAGGVCRCQHCGTIQTVPSTPSKAQDRGAVPAAKTLYRGHRKEEHLPEDSHHGSGSGLDQLAEIVSSSGLSSNSRRLRSQPGNGSPIPVTPHKSNSGPMIVAIVAAALLILAIVALLVLRGSENRSQSNAPASPPNSPPVTQMPTVAAAGPNIAGMPIQAQDTVIYLLDDGFSASDILPSMQSAIYQSIQSLGKERRFKVILWRDRSPAYPPEGTSKATADELAKCQTALRDAYGQGNPQVDAAMKSAMAEQPDAIVLFTAKAVQLTDDFAQTVLALRGDSHVRIYTIAVNGDSAADPSKSGVMAAIAAKTDGKFLNLSSADLMRQGH